MPRRIRLGNKRGALFANLQATAAQRAGRLRPLEPDSYRRRPRILRDSGGAVRVLSLRRRIGDVLPSRGLRSPTDDCAPALAFWRHTQSSPRKYVLDDGAGGESGAVLLGWERRRTS